MKNKKTLWIGLGIIVVLCVALAGIIIAIIFSNKDKESKYEEQIALGDKYLEEMQYEDAILAYTQAINLRPKQAQGYIQLSEVYYVQEDYDSAMQVLDACVTNVGSADTAVEKQKEKVNTAIEEKQNQDSDKDSEDTSGEDGSKSDKEDSAADNGEKEETDAAKDVDQSFIRSSALQEYKGTIYTIYPQGGSDWVYVGDDYMDYLLVYRDHIYYMDQHGTGGGVFSIVRMNLDMSDPMTLTANAYSSLYYAYDGYLYYSYGEEYNNNNTISYSDLKTHRINLDTLEETAYSTDYGILYMDENGGYATTGDDYNTVCSFNGDFQNMTSFCEIDSFYNSNYVDKDFLYFVKYDYETNTGRSLVQVSRTNPQVQNQVVTGADNITLTNGSVYYSFEGDADIYRKDLASGAETSQNMALLGQYTNKWFTCAIGDWVYLQCLKPSDSTQDFYRFSMTDGTTEYLGNWFES